MDDSSLYYRMLRQRNSEVLPPIQQKFEPIFTAEDIAFLKQLKVSLGPVITVSIGDGPGK